MSEAIDKSAGPRGNRWPHLLAVGLLSALAATPALAAPPQLLAGPDAGSGAGQVSPPAGIAVHQSDGVISVADENNFRIDRFDSAGHFLSAFGFGVADGTTNALQTCTTTCFRGLPSAVPGSVHFPQSAAVDQASGDLWVLERGGIRIAKLSPTGQFLLMIGKGVDQGPHHPGNLCKASYIAEGDTCGDGSFGSGPGELSNPEATLALGPTGELWVGDKERLEHFSPEGEFLGELAVPGVGNVGALAIDTDPASPAFEDFYALKRPVNGKNEEQQINPPAAGTYTLGFGGKTTGPIPAAADRAEVAAPLEALPTIDKGNVSVGQRRVTFGGKFAALDVEQLTASEGASVTTIRQGEDPLPGAILKLSPTGTLLEELDPTGFPRALGTDPATGVLYVSEQREPFWPTPAALLSYAPSGAQTARFAAGQVIGKPEGNTLAFGDSKQRLYVASDSSRFVSGTGGVDSAVQAFALPPAGPYLNEGSLAATPRPASATLSATLIPEGVETHYHFQYVSQADFESEGGFAGPNVGSTPTVTLPADFAEHEASAQVTGLTAETAYRFRLLAANPNGEGNTAATGPNQAEEASFQTLPPIVIESTSALEVTSDSAELVAELNDLGEAAEYRFEYLTEAAYQQNLAQSLEPFTGASLLPVPDASLEPQEGDQSVSQTATGLQPHTAYRYRVFAHGPGGFKAGPAEAFTTQTPATTGLPDQRGYELVSPTEKHGAIIHPKLGAGLYQAAADGGAFSYLANGPTEAEPAGFSEPVQILSRRGPGSWESQDIATPHEAAVGFPGGVEYRFFSEQLESAIVEPTGQFTKSISPQASELTPYLRTNFPPADPSQPCTSSCYRPLISGCPEVGLPCPAPIEEVANVPAGTTFGEIGGLFLGASPDAHHIVFAHHAPLIEEAPIDSLYEWSAGELALLSVLPGGLPAKAATRPELGYLGPTARPLIARNAVSADGNRVVFSEAAGSHHLYLRDLAAGETIQIDQKQPGASGPGAVGPIYQDASEDGSRIFFTDSQQLVAGASTSGADLYECEVTEEEGEPKCDLRDLTAQGSGEGAAVFGLIAGASKDGTAVYFTANGKLAAGPNARGEEAVAGNCESKTGLPESERCNLYARTGGQTKLVAVLSGADFPDFALGGGYGLVGLTDRVSPDGRYLAFMSQRPLSGYDNRDAASGKPDQEVFLYDAAAGGGQGELICASCNPTGARPHGVPFGRIDGAAGGIAAGGFSTWPAATGIAANIPPLMAIGAGTFGLQQPRYLNDRGRLFFNSSDALVPTDTNGTEDVYQYEPPAGAEEAPSADSCTTSSPTYSPASLGCVSLISSGTSASESAFLDASESGDDVFFLTSAQLSKRDTDTARDVYDARSGGGEAEAPRPVECTGDACQQPAVPPNDATPGSLTFQGAGNELNCPKGKVKKSGKCVAKKSKKHKHHKKSTKRHAKVNRGAGK